MPNHWRVGSPALCVGQLDSQHTRDHSYSPFSLHLIPNPNADIGKLSRVLLDIGLTEEAHALAASRSRGFSGYHPTPLVGLGQIAVRCNVAAVLYKNEAYRFSIGTFKALGGIQGVHAVLGRESSGDSSPAAQRLTGSTERPSSARRETLCCATDGNHGRAVAWAALPTGSSVVIYVPDACTTRRERQLKELGAHVIRIRGSYEQAHDQAISAATNWGWHLVSDTGTAGQERVPTAIISGYELLFAEAEEELGQKTPLSHVFVQAGTGGLAAAAVAYFHRMHGREAPIIIVVEAAASPCLMLSAAASRPVVVPGPHETEMSGLACGAASTVAWRVLAPGASAFTTITDQGAYRARALLSETTGFQVQSGLSGVASLGALLESCKDPHSRRVLNLDPASRVLVVGTEAP